MWCGRPVMSLSRLFFCQRVSRLFAKEGEHLGLIEVKGVPDVLPQEVMAAVEILP